METSFWNLEFKSLYCDCVEEPANLLQVTCAHSIKTELIVYVRLSREHKMCDTQFLSFWTHSLFGEKKNSCAKKAIIQGSIWWLCTPFFINSVPSKKNYFCCYNQKSNIGEKTVKLGLKGQLNFTKQRNEGGLFKQVRAGAKVQRLKYSAIFVWLDRWFLWAG